MANFFIKAKDWLMEKKGRLIAVSVAGVVLVGAVVSPFIFNGKKKDEIVPAEFKQGTYRTYTTVMPSNWNELTYADNNDTQIMNYLASSFYEYDYKFDESKGGKFKKDGSINADAIVAGGFTTNFSAATALEDVTSTVDAKWGYTDEQKEEGSYAWKITLRKDLKWDDGSSIDAHDFVYTMRQQLDPAFKNLRASTYYTNIMVKNSYGYVYQGESGWFPSNNTYKEYTADLDEKLVFSIGNGAENVEKDGTVSYFRTAFGFPESYNASAVANYLATYYVTSVTAEQILALEGKTFAQIKADATLKATWDAIIGWWQTDPNEELHFFLTEYTYPDMAFADVGLYAASDYEIVICLDNPIECLKEDGSLSYEAAYSFASLPLVKESLYEACKVAPAEGAELWTTKYNTSLDTTASWGPYKLVAYETDKSYRLERNEYWYGYNLPENKNQYNVTAIYCEKIADVNTQWMAFLSGKIDDIGLDVDHKDDYRNSKYTTFSPGTGTFGINLYADLNGLKASGRNNGILAIKDFRQAISLYLDRDDYNQSLYTSHQSCYGIIGPSYYYDVENGGVYRATEYAKKGLLRTYGFTETAEGWTDGKTTYADYEEAYEAMNGMNRALAKELINKAYAELTAKAEEYGYDASKKIEIKFGTSTDNENTRRQYNYMVEFMADLLKDTTMEGKVEVTFDASFGEGWADDFKEGAYDMAAGTGFSGGAFDPAGFLQCYLDPDAGLMYSVWWETDKDILKYTMPAGDYAGAGEELEMTVYNWYCCLNGIAESKGQAKTYNWGAGAIPEEARLQLLSKLEELVLEKYYIIMTTSQYSATVNGAKFTNFQEEYNIFMGFGGMRYQIVNYTDAEWTQFVSANNGDLTNEYKKEN